MRLFDLQLEERLAAAIATDEVVRELADELECADFVTMRARLVFAAARNVQAGGVPRDPARAVDAESVCVRIALDDQMHQGRKEPSPPPFAPDDVYAMLFAGGGPYETITDAIRGITQLRYLRTRRDALLALDEQATHEKREQELTARVGRWAS